MLKISCKKLIRATTKGSRLVRLPTGLNYATCGTGGTGTHPLYRKLEETVCFPRCHQDIQKIERIKANKNNCKVPKFQRMRQN